MRKLFALVAILALGQTATAESNMSTNAELRLRGISDADMDGMDSGATTGRESQWQQRLKLGMDFNAGEKFSAHAELYHTNMWGQTYSSGVVAADPAGDNGKAVLDGTGNQENVLLVNQAYGTWAINDSTSFRFGRGSFTLADGSVIGQNDWEYLPYAFDGMMVTHDMEFGRLSGFYVKFADFQNLTTSISAGVDDPEVNAYGLSLDIKSVPDIIKMLNFHVIQVNQDELKADGTGSAAANAPIPGESYMRYGLTVAGEAGMFNFKLAYASVGGENKLDWATGGSASNNDIASSMMDVALGLAMPDMMDFKATLVYHSDTGCKTANCPTTEDDEQYDGFYYEKHENGGAMDAFYWGNLSYTGLRLSIAPMDDMTVGLDYYMFSQTEKTGSNTGNFGGTAGATAAQEDSLGSEIDLWVGKKYEGGLEVYARYSQFTPGDEYKNSSEDTWTQMFLETKMTF